MSYLGQQDVVAPPPAPVAPPVDVVAPPPVEAPRYAMVIGWGAVLAITVGIFYATAAGKPVAANRKRRRKRRSSRQRRRSSRLRANKAKRRSTRRFKRRSTRRRPSLRRRTSRRGPGLRHYKALSATSRSQMPEKDFALSGRRFPIAGPPGSSRERDKWQAMQAIRYLNMGRVGTKRDYLNVRNAIIRRYGMAFWRQYDGPAWLKIQQAKRRRAATRRRPVRRRLAANPKIVGNVRRTSRRQSRSKKNRRLVPNDLREIAMRETRAAAKQMPATQYRTRILNATRDAEKTHETTHAQWRKQSRKYRGKKPPKLYFRFEHDMETKRAEKLHEVMVHLQNAIGMAQMEPATRQALIKVRNDWLKPLSKHYSTRVRNLSRMAA